MRVRAPALVSLALCAAILPGGYAMRRQIRGETAPVWSLCKDVEWKTVDNGDKPYRRIYGEISSMTVEQADALFHEKLPGWVRTKHMQCFIDPTCYIDNATGTRIEFGKIYSLKLKAPAVWVKEVRWLSPAEKLAYEANSSFRDHTVQPMMIPPPLEPGPVSSGGCWVQPYGTKW